MGFVSDLFALMVVGLYLIAVPLLLLALPAVILFGLTYLLAGPEFRIRMLGWAPGVRHGVRKAMGLAQTSPDRSAGGSR